MTQVTTTELAWDLNLSVNIITDMARSATRRGVDVGYVPGINRAGMIDAERFIAYRNSRLRGGEDGGDDEYALVASPGGNAAFAEIAKLAVDRPKDEESREHQRRAAISGLSMMLRRRRSLSMAQVENAAALLALWEGCDGKTFDVGTVKPKTARQPMRWNRPLPVMSMVGSPALSMAGG